GADHLRHPGHRGQGAYPDPAAAVAAQPGRQSARSAAGHRSVRADPAAGAGRVGGGRMTEMRNTLRRSAVRAVAIVSGAALLAGCQFGGLNSLNLPGTAGHGPGSYVVTVDVPDIATLPQ